MQAALRFIDNIPEAFLEARRPRLWLSLLCLLLWLPGFFNIPAGDRDEARFAQASRQMVVSGDYVRIMVGDEERNKKPVGIHWAQAASVHLAEALHLGTRDDIWPYRVPGLIGAWLAVLATFHWGRALVGRRAAMLAGTLLASCLVLIVETHIAKTDAALLATVAGMMGLFARLYLAPGTFTNGQALAFWAMMGASVLLKGPIGPMVVLLTGISLAIADRRAPWFRGLRLHWGLPLVLLICLPWLVAIGIATDGRFFSQAVGGDMLGKVGNGDEKHWGPPGYYLLTFGIAAFPGAFLVLRSLPTAWSNRLQPSTRFLLAWIIPTWLVFEAVATKLPHYTLPTYPALMLLAGAWAMDPLRRPAPRWLAGIGWFFLFLVPIGLAIGAVVLPHLADNRADWWALLAIPFAALPIWGAVRAMRAGHPSRAGILAAILTIPLTGFALQHTIPSLRAPWLSPRIATLLSEVAPGVPYDHVGLVGYQEASMLFATSGDLQFLDNAPAAADFLAEAPGRVAVVGSRSEAAFQRRVAELGLKLTVLGETDGFVYTRGRMLGITIYKRAD